MSQDDGNVTFTGTFILAVGGGGRWSHYGGASGTTPPVVNGG